VLIYLSAHAVISSYLGLSALNIPVPNRDSQSVKLAVMVATWFGEERIAMPGVMVTVIVLFVEALMIAGEVWQYFFLTTPLKPG
jgi:hypothetical protein